MQFQHPSTGFGLAFHDMNDTVNTRAEAFDGLLERDVKRKREQLRLNLHP
jgi:hypothetical protein